MAKKEPYIPPFFYNKYYNIDFYFLGIIYFANALV